VFGRRVTRRGLGAAAMMLLLAGCGGTAAPSAPASAAPASAAAASAAAKPAGSAAASAKPAASASAKPAASGSAAAKPATQGVTTKVAGHDAQLKLAKPLSKLSPAVTVNARVGNSTTTAPFWYALDRGYFDQLGITFNVVNITQSTDIVGPLATGQLDVAGAAGGAGIYNAVNRGTGVTAEADNGKLFPGLSGAAAVVKHGELASYPTSDWCALKGKTVGGVDAPSNFYATLVRALQSCKLTIKDVNLAGVIPFPLLNEAVVNGKVQVGFQVDPFVTAGVAAGQLDKWKAVEDAWPAQQMNYLLYSPAFSKKTDAALRFMVAYIAGARDYNAALAPGGNKQEFAELIAAHLGGAASTYLAINPTGVDKNGQIDVESTKEEIQIFQEAGSVPPGAINLNWIKSDLRDQALSYLGS
jgi:NitT/TauT family transport system substrate-binding protein